MVSWPLHRESNPAWLQVSATLTPSLLQNQSYVEDYYTLPSSNTVAPPLDHSFCLLILGKILPIFLLGDVGSLSQMISQSPLSSILIVSLKQRFRCILQTSRTLSTSFLTKWIHRFVPCTQLLEFLSLKFPFSFQSWKICLKIFILG